jgi:predicted nuclease with RNAse H fold
MKDVRTFVGVDLGGGKGKNTAVAQLERTDEGLRVVYSNTDKGYDDLLIEFLRPLAGAAIVAIDAPLSLPSCVRCVEPVCPTLDRCEVPIVSWFRTQANGALKPGTKPKYTPYTQRGSEVLLAEEHQILPRETLGQGMGPLTARGQYLTRALRGAYQLNENLIEVYPKATLTKLFPEDVAQYKRSGRSRDVRLKILNKLSTVLTFGPGQWREHAIENDHKFDAIICAYTAYLWSRGECVEPPNDVLRDDGWIWFPRSGAPG